jgi:hypothetical protein
MPANFLVGSHKFAAVRFGEFMAAGLVDVGTNRNLVPDISVGLRVFPGDSSGTDYADSQMVSSGGLKRKYISRMMLS